jgi:alpha-D-xyloside xylohydrolase
MKIKDGFWLMRAGLRGAFATQAYQVDPGEESLHILAPTSRIERRGDTLRGPVLTVDLSAPMPGVVSVKVTHFAGGVKSEPHFRLNTAPSPERTSVSVTDEVAELVSGDLRVRVHRDDWQLDFIGGDRLLTSSGRKCLGAVENDSGRHFMVEQLALEVGESIYGLGERFGALVKNGQSIDIWNADGGTSSEQAYKNVPFYLSNRGYGVFVNTPAPVSYEVGSETVSRVQFSVEAQELEYLVIYGPTPKDVLRRYTALTGRPALPPAWSFGLWLTTSFTTSYDEDTVNSFIDGMASRDIPLHVFHFDCFWMREYHWCDLEWNTRMFPDPPGMLARLRERGLRISLWINPYVAQASPMFAEGQREGYLLRRSDGSVWQWDRWQPGMALVDFTNPAARRWYADRLRALLDMGVDCFKTDFGERIPTDVVYFDGSDPERMHNYYTYLYNETVFDLLEKSRGPGEAVVFARSATAGSQQFPVHWGGDNAATFPSMAESLRGGLSLGMSGFGFWSHDIGGFEGMPDAALFKRWSAFGLLSSHSRLHGNESYRVPWLFDEEAVDVLRSFTRLKCRLMPYLYGTAVVAHQEGVPALRQMLLEFPDDPAVTYLDRQYMLGDSLLVAPVLSASGSVEYYIPAGSWTNLLTGEVVERPGWRQESHGFDSLPLLVRPGSVIPMGSVDDRPDYDFADGVTLHVFGLDSGGSAQVIVPALDGSPAAVFSVVRDGDEVTASLIDGVAPGWSVLLEGVHEVVSSGVEQTARGVRLRPHENQVVVRLRGALEK